MARGRMLNKKISENIEFNTLLPDDTCRLLATWIIAHLDKNGVFYAEPILVKSMVLPWRADVSVQQVERYLLAMEQAGLIVIFQAKGQRWQWWPGFITNQVGLRQDRETSDYPDPANFIDAPATAEIAAPPDDRNGDGNAPITNEGSGEYLPEESRINAGSLPEESPPNIREVNLNLNESLPKGNGEKSPTPPAESIPKTEKPGKKQPLRQSGKPKEPPPPAVEAYHGIASRFPHKATWEDIVKKVGDSPTELERWRDTIRAYIGCGWNPNNVRGMLGYFERREIPGQEYEKARQNGHTRSNSTNIAGLREKGGDNPIKKIFSPATGETYWIDIRTKERVPDPGTG